MDTTLIKTPNRIYSQVRHVATVSKHPVFQLIYLIWTQAPEKK